MSTRLEDVSILRLIDAAGGYHAGAFADGPASDRCVSLGLIIPEGDAGYALTVEGTCALRAARLAAA